MAFKWKYANRRTNSIGADEALDAGLDLELAPYKPKEVVADSQGRYIGQNGYTVDDLDMVGTGRYINATDWLQMPEGYSKVKNPYMAATPDQIADRQTWAQQGTNPNDVGLMGDDSYKQVLQYQQDWADAQARGDQAAMDAAHAAAEEIRAKYGYSGGADGSEYLGLMAYTGGAGYDGAGDGDGYGGAYGFNGYGDTGYVSRWQSQIDALTDAILGRDPFSYDKNKDPLYQQYKESYTRGGQRGMQDTLAQVSARTGGLASSYAEYAAQQTYNNYMAQLADKVPELQQLAYSMYMDDIAMDRADLNMLMGLDDTDYGRWSDNRNFNYGAYRDSVGDQQWQQQFAYQQAQDALAQQNWEKQFNYDADWAQKQWDYNVMQDQLAREDALRKLYASGGGGDGTEPTGSVWSAISGMGDEIQVYEYLMGNVKNQDDREYFLSKWMEQQEMANNYTPGLVSGEVNLSDTRGTNYQETNDYLKQMKQEGYSVEEIRAFINQAYNQGVLTPTDYQRLTNQYR